MRRWGTAVAALALAGAGVAASAGAATASVGSQRTVAATCSTAWGSLDKTGQDTDYRPLLDIRAGRHDCYDRLVFDISASGGNTGYRVGYVDKFHQDGSGEEIPVNGGAILQISVDAPSYDPVSGAQTYAGRAGETLPGVDVTGYRTFQDTRFGASFEGQTQVAVGVRARLPFRVLQSGDQLIVDVAHTW
ncbi:AMIN-like domain-containing (lipo)protein [Streptomyces palmae]|uniref:AMIN-like domain-containing protein n=1 Tax=Streptomyces palmae TaxID=1701085 RepID=A0A4Z0GCV6_9ACTN|nr:hypothetical protein [Streptomyces palmae]TGA93785.1 hypothetical protein E4099_26430 [Streptomyces palmae]